MFIERSFDGQTIKIELTNDELQKAAGEFQEDQMTDDILEKYSGIHGCEPSDEVFDRIMSEYKQFYDDLYVAEDGKCGPAHELVRKLCYDNPPAKKLHWIVNCSMLCHGAIEVEAVTKQEALRLADQELDHVDWEPTDDSQQLDSIYCDEDGSFSII